MPTLDEAFRTSADDNGPNSLLLTSISDLDVGPDGRIYLLDGANASVVVLDSSGKRLDSWGRRGRGPGEFRRPSSLVVIRDTVWVLDWQIKAFSLSGSHLLTITHPRNRPFWGELAYGSRGIMFLATHAFTTDDRGRMGQFADTARLYFLQGGEMVPTEFAFETWRTFQYRKNLYLAPPFAPRPVAVLGPDGSVFFSRGDRWLIERIDVDGVVGRFERHFDLQPITESQHESRISAIVDTFSNQMNARASEQQDFRAFLNALPRIQNRPVLGRMISADNGIAVERLDLMPLEIDAENPTVWDLLRIEGPEEEMQFAVPANVRPLLIQRGSLYAITYSDDDVPILLRYRMPEKGAH